MPEGFVIMQIGNGDLDRMCDDVIFPALHATELEPRRVDRHNEGDLLKSEIVAFIERAEVIVADLTNERPNVYLEVGYTMGLGKKTNLPKPFQVVGIPPEDVVALQVEMN